VFDILGIFILAVLRRPPGWRATLS
jgi:hypothetical protein